jgi:hypothetical protein
MVGDLCVFSWYLKSMSSNLSTPRGNFWLRIARVLALAFMLSCVFVFLLGVAAFNKFAALYPDLFTVYSWSAAAMAAVLSRMGLTFNEWLTFNQLTSIASALVFCSVGGLIYIRKRDDWFSLYVAVWMVMFGTLTANQMFGTLIPSQMGEAAGWYPALANIVSRFAGLPWPMFFLFFYLFPDGHFVPRWTRWAGVVIVLDFLAILLLYGTGDPPPVLILVLLLAIGIGVASQFYRYRRVSGAVQRQQTKWVVFALLILFGAILLTAIPMLFPVLRDPGGALAFLLPLISIASTLGFMLVPLAIGVAILRYRLWDVDLLIRRTLVYGALTATLVVVYLSAVLIIQALVGRVSGRLPAVAIVGSTLLIAALFNPLRRRIQRDIDRRFYRRKYDAEKTIANFSGSIRNEVELEQMTADLLAIVDDSLRPESLSLWIKPIARQ